MSRRKKFIAALVALSLLAGAVIWLIPEPPPPPPLPVPNGYDDFVAAGKLVVGNPPESKETNIQVLRAFLNNNTNALRLLRNGLVRECRVSSLPLKDSPNYFHDRLRAFKLLAMDLAAEARLAELEQRTNDTVQSYLDEITFGQQQARGGVIIDRLTGVACENVGSERLARLVPSLDALICRTVIIRLETLEVKRESADEMLTQEAEWRQRSLGWRDKANYVLAFKGMKQLELSATKKINQSIRGSRHLLIDFAVRAYQLETGKQPKSFADLVPAYLRSIPVDPETGAALKYSFD